MRASRPPSIERGLHVAAWSMMGTIALFLGVTATLIPVIVWSMVPPGRHTTALHPQLAEQAFGAPLGLLAVAAALAVAASLVVFGVAATMLRAPQPDAVPAPLARR
ncbi:MAG: hypothetical protein K1X95_01195 [Acidimicrobiia bacterium]|nr:hypothetical protein [Acidimicrobiia bacterium]